MKILLIGFMYSGKTTVGKLIAKHFNLDFIDMDQELIASTEYDTIQALFKERGESFFRELETETAKKLGSKDNLVIASGGGIVENPENLEILNTVKAQIIYLHCSWEQILARHNSAERYERPLFEDLRSAKALFESRQSLYENFSDLNIPTEGKSAEEVAELICGKLI